MSSTPALPLAVSVRIAVAALALASSGIAAAQDASPWQIERNVRTRLIAGLSTPTERWAAIEIVLDPGFKTYWRDPGESGLPPVLDWTGSVNAGAIAVLWPAPSRLEDQGGVANGYRDRLVLPVRVTPREPGEAVRLDLEAEFGICHDICIPVRTRLDLALPAARTEQPDAIAEALASVPKVEPMGAPGPLSILTIERVGNGPKPVLLATVRAPIASAPQLFVEAPPNWFMSVSDPERAAAAAPDIRTFRIEVAETPREPANPVALTFTLSAEGAAIETSAAVDVGPIAR